MNTDQDLLNAQLADGGPLYAETNLHALIKEPFNMTTALFFVGISVYWIYRLRGHWRPYWLLVTCHLVLLVGGVGGALFHGLRTSHVFLLLDVVPIFLLTLGFAAYLWLRLFRQWYTALLVPVLALGLNGVIAMTDVSQQLSTTLGYASLGLLIITPLFLFLARNRFRHARFIWGALSCFTLALTCRMLDPLMPDLLPIGFHWLWHSFGAGAAAFIAQYWYRVELERVGTPILHIDKGPLLYTPPTTVARSA